MCAVENCGSYHDAKPGTYRNVNRALFSCHGKINPPFGNLKSLPGIAEAILFLEERRIRACPERSAELPLELCRRIRIFEKASCYEGGEK